VSSSPHSTVLVGTDGSDSPFPAVEGAVDALLQLVEQRGVDQVGIGNRGLDSLAGRVPGSVPANISHRARCDVLIVHTTGRGAKQQG
jgi:nucleotide-binding universal stress UspA family protein